MKPGTVGAPPGDLRVEYFNCTFTPSVCLQRRGCCSRIRWTVSHKLSALHTAGPPNPAYLSSSWLPTPPRRCAQKRQMAARMGSGKRHLILSPISCCWCNINQPSIVISLLSVFQNRIDGGWKEAAGILSKLEVAYTGRENHCFLCHSNNSLLIM